MYTRIGIRDLRADLAAAIRRARSGERTVITDRGQPVAELGPPATEAEPNALDPLLHRGALIAPRRTGERRTPRPVSVWSGARLDRALRELRG
jgi:prevent-host-death family protein